VYGTDGSGLKNLLMPSGGMRQPCVAEAPVIEDDSGNARTANDFFMNGAEIFTFALRVVPDTVHRLLSQSGLTLDDIDLFVFHQANQFMLEHLRKKLKLPTDKFVIDMADVGNTSSSTIPIALKRALQTGRITSGQRLMLVGFGVGYSWAGSLIRWR
jgi:3-oxoacyl-[acyl-carrier-protein] synthase-3